MVVNALRDDARRLFARRRRRRALAPAQVALPLTAAVLGVAAGGLLAAAVGAPPLGIVVVVAALSALALLGLRPTLSSLATGAGLKLARPYEAGDLVRVFVPCLDRTVDAEIVRVGAANTTLLTEGGLVVLPNTRMVRGAPTRA